MKKEGSPQSHDPPDVPLVRRGLGANQTKLQLEVMSTASDGIGPLRDAKAMNRLVGPLPDAKALNRLVGPLPDAKALARAIGSLPDAKALARAIGSLPDTKALDRAIGSLPDAKALNRAIGSLPDTKALNRLAGRLPDTKALDRAIGPLPDTKALNRAIGPMLDAKALNRLVGPMPDTKALDRLVGPMLDTKALDRLVGPILDSRALTRPDLEIVREHLGAQHRIDSGDVGPQELFDAATREDVLDDGDTSAGRIPVDPRGRVDGDQPVTSGRIARAWRVLQVLLTLDNFLGDPGVTAVRETVGDVANEVLLLILLVAVSQAPPPPPVPTVPVPKALTTPTHVAEGSLTSASRCAERQPATLERKGGLTED